MNFGSKSLHLRGKQIVSRAVAGICGAGVVAVLSGCMAAVPASFPTISLPSPQQQPQQQQSGQPSSAPQSGKPGGKPGSTGTSPAPPRALPSPPGSGTPQLPSSGPPGPPGGPSSQSGSSNTPGLPGMPQPQDNPSQRDSGQADESDGDSDSENSSEGTAADGGESSQQQSGIELPTLPGLPPQSGDQAPGDVGGDGGSAGQNSSVSTGSARQQGGNAEVPDPSGMPSGPPKFPDLPDGESETDISPGSENTRQAESGDDGESMNTPSGDPQATPEDEDDPGWVVSNTLPEAEKIRSSPEEADEEEELGAKSAGDEELEQKLAGIDGSILSDREEQTEKVNEQAGGPTLPGTLEGDDFNEGLQDEDGDGNQPTAVGGTSPEAMPNSTAVCDAASTDADLSCETKPLPPEGLRPQIARDIPDARDDDVIARQLREAALAEKDPKVREGLWEELRRYVEKRK